MAKVLCDCGESLWNGEIPNQIEFHAFSDVQLIDMFNRLEKFEADQSNINDEYWRDRRDDILWPPINVWRCPKCKRLYAFEIGRDTASRKLKYIYKLEEQL